MRKTASIIIISCLSLAVCSCGGKPTAENENEQQSSSVAVAEDGASNMEEYNLSGTVEVDGMRYDYEFSFNNDPTLPVVTTAEGQKYHDNNVRLIISRGNETVYDHKFTKESFVNAVPAKDFKRSVLAGFNFNYMQQDKHDRFYFIAVVGDPDETSDISHSVGIAIDKSGTMSYSAVQSIDVESMDGSLNQDPDENDA